MKVVVSGRKCGKTQKAVDWVREGQRVYGYPGWSRVMLVHNVQEEIRVRAEYSLDPKQIFSIESWQRAHNVHPDTEVCIENLDLYLHNLIGRHGLPRMATITGEVDS